METQGTASRSGSGTGTVAIVTGGADGIGWATARRLALEVDHVVVADLRTEAAAARAAELGDTHWSCAANVADEAAVVAMVEAVIARHGRIDILVNNAGVAENSVPTIEQSVESFDRVLGVHLRGTFLASREVGRAMLTRGSGSIINIASIAGLAGIPERNAYGAAKAGIAAMTRSMACEWAAGGVRVNAVAPGYVRTALVDELERQGTLDARAIIARTPMGRMARPEEIAEVIAFLASPRASFVTGTTVNADGGWLAVGAPEGVLSSPHPPPHMPGRR